MAMLLLGEKQAVPGLVDLERLATLGPPRSVGKLTPPLSHDAVVRASYPIAACAGVNTSTTQGVGEADSGSGPNRVGEFIQVTNRWR